MLLKVLLALALSSPFWDLGHPLWEIDDARYAEIPREMVERGDWLTPTLDYVDYIEKPPLAYWMSALSYRAFGVGEAASRFPLALTALVGIVGAWWLASWLFSAAAGTVAALILATSVQYAVLSHVNTLDMALTASLVWTTGLILRCLRRPADGRWAGPLAWVAAAAALLSKGLVGLLLPALWTAALLALFPDLRRGARALLRPAGPLLFAALAVPWLAAMSLAHERFLEFFFVEQHFTRYLTARFNRGGPAAYFLAVELGGALPWTAAAAAAVLVPLARRRRADERELQLALWVLFVFAFFSLSSSKLPTYILPLFPHQAVLAAALLARIEREPALERRVRAGSAALAVLLAAAAALAVPLAPPGLDRRAAAAAAAAAGLLAAACAALARSSRAVPAAAALALGSFAVALAGARLAEGDLSIRPLARALAKDGAAGRLIAYNAYPHGLSFYARRPVDPVNWIGELTYARSMPRFRRRFGDDDLVRALAGSPERAHAVLPARELPYFASLTPLSELRAVRRAGAWTAVTLGGQ